MFCIGFEPGSTTAGIHELATDRMTETKAAEADSLVDARAQDAGTIAASHSGNEELLYPPIAELSAIGDRRTAAVISADGTVRWLCLPNYDGVPVFGSLLDAERGGRWVLGPTNGAAGRPSYLGDSNILVTIGASADSEIELTDAMLSPGNSRPAERRGRAGVAAPASVRARFDAVRHGAHARVTISRRASPFRRWPGGLELRVGGFALGLWTSRPVASTGAGVAAAFESCCGRRVLGGAGAGRQAGGVEPRSGRRSAAGDAAILAGVERHAMAIEGRGGAASFVRLWRSSCSPTRRRAPSWHRRQARFPSGSAATATTTTGIPGYATPRWRSPLFPCWATWKAPSAI